MKLLALHTQNQPEQVTSPGQISDCDTCNGNCPKPDKYYLDGGYCKYGIALVKRRACQKAHIPDRYIGKTFSDYQVTSDNAEAVKIARWYTATKPAKGLYLYGNCGTGKTYLASLIAQEFIGQGVIFGDVPDLMARLKATFDDGGTEALLKRYTTCGLLILDDIGAGQITPWNVGILYQVINARYNAEKPVIATSNYDLDGLQSALKADALTAKRIISRLSEMTIQAFLGLKDRRK